MRFAAAAHWRYFESMLEGVVKTSSLAFSHLGTAPDEQRSGKQQNEWSGNSLIRR